MRSDDEQVAWLVRRAGFGPAPGELAEVAQRGVAAEVERLTRPDTAGVAAATEPWNDADYPPDGTTSADHVRLVADWLDIMVGSPRRLAERMAWFWHGHLVSGRPKVHRAHVLMLQGRLFRARALGDFGALLRDVTIDPAMLVYLDGRTSTGEAPNENYSRELMELFALGIGQYTEADVQAGARALTGWIARKRDGFEARLVDSRHDDTPQRFLGRDDVHDLDTVIAAVLEHPACGPFLAAQLAADLLGPGVPTEVSDPWGREFAAAGYDLALLCGRILEAGLADDSLGGTVVRGPLVWRVAMERAIGVHVPTFDRVPGLGPAGQLPFVPPNVAGWPSGAAWFSTQTVVGRANMAGEMATHQPADSEVAVALRSGDTDRLAVLLGRPDGLGAATRSALGALSPEQWRAGLVVLLTSPEAVLA